MAAVELEEAPNQENFVTVRTLLPIRPMPSNTDRPAVTTEHLLLRAISEDDMRALHALRSQEEVMRWSYAGRVDLNQEETEEKMRKFLPPTDVDHYLCALCWKETGELIGTGGCHNFRCEFGWPELGYMIRSEYWGKGLATEFLQAWLVLWSSLPRAETELRVDPRTVTGGVGWADEQLIAMFEASNGASKRVLQKCGFEYLLTWKGDKLSLPGQIVPLPTFRFYPSRKSDQ